MDERLSALYDRVDAFFDAAVQAVPSSFACRAGCDGCCRYDLELFGVEIASLREAFRALSVATREAVGQRAREGSTCVFRDPATGRCDVYASRPLICRTHGLAVLADGRIDACPLNFREGWPPREHLLDLERVNQPLALVNRMAGFDGARTSLADLVTSEVVHGR